MSLPGQRKHGVLANEAAVAAHVHQRGHSVAATRDFPWLVLSRALNQRQGLASDPFRGITGWARIVRPSAVEDFPKCSEIGHTDLPWLALQRP